MSDLISRQAAIEALQNHYEVRNPKQNAIMDECVMLILKLPSAQPERKGEWTVTPVYIKCSECGESFMLIPQNYCPNCGAFMVREAD